MITDVEINDLFPIPVGDVYVRDEKLIKELVDEIYAEMERDPEGTKLSNRGGWQSNNSSPIGPVTQSLREILLPTVKEYYYKCFRSKSAENLRITGLWANVNPKGTYNTQHIHPGSQVSGVLYLKVPDNCAKLDFHNPARESKMQLVGESYEEYNNYNSDTFWFGPVIGRLILFPSHLPHSVEISESDDDRVSIAFNASYFNRRYD